MKKSALRRPARLVSLLAILSMAACASSGRRTAATPFSDDLAERKEVQIKIINANFSDATVWALIRDGQRRRLGLVTGKTDAVFTLPWTFSEPLRLEFDLVANVRCLTEQIMVDPGDLLELQISVDPSTDRMCSRR
jgi:hypothetical protein